MSEIYRGCTVDLLWLGKEEQWSGFERAVQIMDLVAKGDIPALGWPSCVWRGMLVREGEEDRDQRAWSMDLDDVNYKISLPKSLHSLCATNVILKEKI